MRIAFIGGDRRNYLLSNMLKDKGEVVAAYLGDDDNLSRCLEAEYIVFPIPFSKDGNMIYTPLSNREISIEECVKAVESKTIFVGNIDSKIKEQFKTNQNKVIDIAKEKEFIKSNSIPTAEGIIKCIIENTDITIDKSNILIIGFGNVGEKTAELLSNLNAKIYCSDIDKHKVANIGLRGYNVLEILDNYIEKMDVIINTVPDLVINENVFRFIKKSTLIIDVASKPGGVDFIYAKEHGYRAIQYLGIPGKVAPRTSAEYMKDIIEKYII